MFVQTHFQRSRHLAAGATSTNSSSPVGSVSFKGARRQQNCQSLSGGDARLSPNNPSSPATTSTSSRSKWTKSSSTSTSVASCARVVQREQSLPIKANCFIGGQCRSLESHTLANSQLQLNGLHLVSRRSRSYERESGAQWSNCRPNNKQLLGKQRHSCEKQHRIIHRKEIEISKDDLTIVLNRKRWRTLDNWNQEGCLWASSRGQKLLRSSSSDLQSSETKRCRSADYGIRHNSTQAGASLLRLQSSPEVEQNSVKRPTLIALAQSFASSQYQQFDWLRTWLLWSLNNFIAKKEHNWLGHLLLNLRQGFKLILVFLINFFAYQIESLCLLAHSLFSLRKPTKQQLQMGSQEAGSFKHCPNCHNMELNHIARRQHFFSASFAHETNVSSSAFCQQTPSSMYSESFDGVTGFAAVAPSVLQQHQYRPQHSTAHHTHRHYHPVRMYNEELVASTTQAACPHKWHWVAQPHAFTQSLQQQAAASPEKLFESTIECGGNLAAAAASRCSHKQHLQRPQQFELQLQSKQQQQQQQQQPAHQYSSLSSPTLVGSVGTETLNCNKFGRNQWHQPQRQQVSLERDTPQRQEQFSAEPSELEMRSSSATFRRRAGANLSQPMATTVAGVAAACPSGHGGEPVSLIAMAPRAPTNASDSELYTRCRRLAARPGQVVLDAGVHNTSYIHHHHRSPQKNASMGPPPAYGGGSWDKQQQRQTAVREAAQTGALSCRSSTIANGDDHCSIASSSSQLISDDGLSKRRNAAGEQEGALAPNGDSCTTTSASRSNRLNHHYLLSTPLGKVSLAGAKRRLGFKQKGGLNSLSVQRSEEIYPDDWWARKEKCQRQCNTGNNSMCSNSLDDPGRSEAFRVPKQTTIIHNNLWALGATDSSDPKMCFVEGLGMGQIASRQALVSPYLGDLQLSIGDQRGMLEVEIIRARRLQCKPCAKRLPSPYVKVYLMKDKKCLAKFKTGQARRSLDPMYQQKFIFRDDYSNCVLQVIVWGDYGKKDRKSLMGVVQVHLDDLDLSGELIVGWYKLFNALTMANTLTSLSSKALRQTISTTKMDSHSQSIEDYELHFEWPH